MAIEKAKRYVPILDKKYVTSSKTSVLDSTEEAKFIKEANTFLVATREFEGLSDYDRTNNKFAETGVNVTWEPYVIDYDRGKMIIVDAADNEESAGMSFLNIAGDFMDTRVTPELDQVRIAKYATKAGNKVSKAITDGETAYKEVRTCATRLANLNVPTSQVVFFINETMNGMIEDLDTYKSKAALNKFPNRVVFPDGYFKTGITLGDGSNTLTGEDIQFIAIDKKAVIQHLTHVAPKIVTPEANNDGDAWKYGYRAVGIADVYKNKVDYIYVCSAPAVEETTPEVTPEETVPEEPQG